MKTPMLKSIFWQSNIILDVSNGGHECTLEAIYSSLEWLLWPDHAPEKIIVGVTNVNDILK